jgi:Ca2+-binding EF-hand superfamily protein
MKKYFLGLVAGATLSFSALGVSPVWAQDAADLFDKLDANKDGVIASDEVPDDKQAIFERLVRVGDANGDKKLTKDELAAGLKKSAAQPEAAPAGRPGAPGGAPGGFPNVNAKEIFARMDRDSNGKLEKDEIPERMKENLGRVDANSDGVVELAEFEKVAQFFGGRRPEGAPAGTPEGRPGQGGPVPGGPVPGGPVLRALDADGDGEISASEIEGAAKALARLDKNGDGKLTRDEIGPPPGGNRPDDAGRPAAGGGAFAEQFLARIKSADTNGDGKLSKEEAPDRLKDQFDRLDSNSDGQLDQAELKLMIERMQRAGGDAPRRRPGAEPKKD